MSNSAAWAYLVALAVPFLCGLLTKCAWPAWTKFTVTVVLALVIGVVTVVLTGDQWTWGTTLPFLVSVIGAAEVWFRYVIERVPGLTEWLQSHLVK